VVICLERSGNEILHRPMVQLMPLPPHHLLLHENPQLVLSFWHRLTQVVLEKRPLNGCRLVFTVTKLKQLLATQDAFSEKCTRISLASICSSVPSGVYSNGLTRASTSAVSAHFGPGSNTLLVKSSVKAG